MTVRRTLGLVYGVAAYAAFGAAFAYMIGFMGGFPVPRSVDGPGDTSWPVAAKAALDAALVALFGLQHSGMARRRFKLLLERVVPPLLERSTYVLASSAVLALLFAAWQPFGPVLWDVPPGAARIALYAVFWSGWVLTLPASWAIDHFTLFGLRQAHAFARAGQPRTFPFKEAGLYALVRHPILSAFLLSAWGVPRMTAAHLLFSVCMSLYIVVGSRFEERDLLRAHPEYSSYRERVPPFAPWPRPRGAQRG